MLGQTKPIAAAILENRFHPIGPNLRRLEKLDTFG
jgi:hypothetical protein